MQNNSLPKSTTLSLLLNGSTYRPCHCIDPKDRFREYFQEEVYNYYTKFVLIGKAWMRGVEFREPKSVSVPEKHKCYIWPIFTTFVPVNLSEQFAGAWSVPRSRLLLREPAHRCAPRGRMSNLGMNCLDIRQVPDRCLATF